MVIFIVFAAVTHAVLYLQFHAYASHFRNEASQPLTMMAPPSRAAVPADAAPAAVPERRPSRQRPPNTNTPSPTWPTCAPPKTKHSTKPGWVDQQKGIVRLPIETAKQLVVQRGLPVVTP